MYSIQFASHDNQTDQEAFNITMNCNFKEQPTWMEISDKFLEFLKANGYIFNINDQLRNVREETTTLDDEFNTYETRTEPKRKAAKKAAKKV